MKRILLSLLLLATSALAFALPSVEAVQAEIKAGHYTQAESMMQEVVAAKPKSAKAHYVYAEILAHNSRFDDAAREARLARELDPALRFTDPAKFRSFEQLLQREQTPRTSTVPSNTSLSAPAAAPARAPVVQQHDSGLPGWVWGIGFAAVAVLIWRLVSRRSAAAAAPSYAGGYGGYGGAPMPTGGSGSGMLGTGLAAAGGFAAGMLAEKMLDGDHHHDDGYRGGSSAAPGGLQPGMFDDDARGAAGELQDRSIDFGSGGDWGGDAGGGDFGGGDAGGGDW